MKHLRQRALTWNVLMDEWCQLFEAERTYLALPAGQMRGMVWSQVGLRPDFQVWLPGATIVVPFAYVNSSRTSQVQMVNQ